MYFESMWRRDYGQVKNGSRKVNQGLKINVWVWDMLCKCFVVLLVEGGGEVVEEVKYKMVFLSEYFDDCYNNG